MLIRDVIVDLVFVVLVIAAIVLVDRSAREMINDLEENVTRVVALR